MVDWFILLTPLLVLPIVLLFVFVGCQFQVAGFRPPFGAPGDIPVPGDYFGTGLAVAAFFRPGDHPPTWHIFGGDIFDPFFSDHPDQVDFHLHSFPFGLPGDIPVPGDYGNGRTQPAVFRPSDGNYHIITDLSFDNVAGTFSFNTVLQVFALPPATFSSANGDHILPPGDYLGDGRKLVGAFVAVTGQWFIRDQAGNIQRAIAGFGKPGDIPLPGDYAGNGSFQVALFRPFEGWHVWDLVANKEKPTIPLQIPSLSGDIPLPPAVYLKPGPNPFAPGMAIYRALEGNYFLTDLNGLLVRQATVVSPGQSGDLAAPAPYTANALVEEVVFRPMDGTWHRTSFDVMA